MYLQTLSGCLRLIAYSFNSSICPDAYAGAGE